MVQSIKDPPAYTVDDAERKSWMQGQTDLDGNYDPSRIGFGSQTPPAYDGYQAVGTMPMSPWTPSYMVEGGGVLPGQPGSGQVPAQGAQTYGGGMTNPNAPVYGGVPGTAPFGGVQPPQQSEPYTAPGYATEDSPYSFWRDYDINNLFEKAREYSTAYNPYRQPIPEREIPQQAQQQDQGPQEPLGYWQDVTSGDEINPRTRSQYNIMPKQIAEGMTNWSDRDQSRLRHMMTRPLDNTYSNR